ncbi:bacteriocin maturation protein [Cohnella kolymensis]|uniref:Bacteriocin maturation protein n=1 Tax=Cohnella kolymensis TaxID=1590652 RepID=A0ABR4ZZP1_9BACL|nr:putative thiazole-containing bacteriocin maturation protein [Cohnella kolymensis]KIL34147.1 bacteriocin maturation protein [Cohnella kolymensis]
MRLNPSARLKVKSDTFYLPDTDGGVYFRNNLGSFRMEGTSIDRWIEKLLPAFNGEHTMDNLTEGLPEPYSRRVYEIAETLQKNGFARDVSGDSPHELTDEVVRKFSSQMEFLDSFTGSGAYRFQKYREVKVLAAGCGPMYVSLISALLESGLPNIHMWITDTTPTDRTRLEELAAYARKTDPAVETVEVGRSEETPSSWHEIVRPYDCILYVSTQGDSLELKAIHNACREEKKIFLPALIVRQAGMAGPLVHPDSDGCWESAWRRVHESAITKDPELHTFSVTAGALLSNVIVFELFKSITGVTGSKPENRWFLLDLETFEGGWHSFYPHPFVIGRPKAQRINDFDTLLNKAKETKEAGSLLSFINRLTSAHTGILHLWEEGDLLQLPLSQCRVQAADPLSFGPAKLLPEIISMGLNHEEARRNAGLSGIEAYLARLARAPDYVGVGTGETAAEGICRGIHKCLNEELRNRDARLTPDVVEMPIAAIEDERSRFYIRVLTTMQGEPVIGRGQDTAGFPVMWVGTNGSWYGSSGLETALALRHALEQALLRAQNQNTKLPPVQGVKVSSVRLLSDKPDHRVIKEYKETSHADVLCNALNRLQQHGKKIRVFDLTWETWLKEELSGGYGVSFGEEVFN